MSRNSAPRHGLSILLLLLLATAGVAFPLAMSGCPGTSDPGVDPGTCLRMPGCETTSSICCDEKQLCQQYICQGVAWICSRDSVGGFRWVDRAGPCDDNNLCTENDICAGGTCQGTPRSCAQPPAPACVDASTLKTYGAGTCDPQSGQCVYAEQTVNCPQGCQNGKCAGDPCLGIKCEQPPGPCHKNPGRCDAQSGNCIYDKLPAGTACTLTNACINNPTCDGNGKCSGTTMGCSAPHASGATCVQGECQGYTCDSGWDNCNNKCSDGCEVDITSNKSHCGGCGKACNNAAHATAVCQNMTCKLNCTAPWQDCNGNKSDGCEIPVGRANACNKSGLSTFSSAAGGTPGCGTPYCGAGSSGTSFGSWHCRFCTHCQIFTDGGSWCLTASGKFSPDRCATCCNPDSYPQVCQ